MSASFIRCACRSGNRLLRFKRIKEASFQTRTKTDLLDDPELDSIDTNYYNDYTAPYFPEEDKIASLQAKYPEVTISAEDFKHVRRILPAKTIPALPEITEYPTPSGWIPPIAEKQPAEYGINRTRNCMLPIYLQKHASGRTTTLVKKVHGDIHLLNADIKEHFKKSGVKYDVMVQIHEVGCFLRYKGNHVQTICDFALKKGF